MKDLNKILQILIETLGKDRIKRDEPMKYHTTFKVGGCADIFAVPRSAAEFASVLRVCAEHKTRFFVIGAGSNVLVKDAGIRGVVISTAMLNKIELSNETTIKAEAGATLKDVAVFALENCLTGFEFAGGIPGSVGGAVFMNAGAYGGEIKDIFHSASVLAEDFSVKKLFRDDMAFGYRKSAVQSGGVYILDAEFALVKGGQAEIKRVLDDLEKRRNDKQPMDMPSAGSTFKRPQGNYASKLIADSGLKGCTIGGAQVSEKHCGFIINKGGATADDILKLIRHVQKTVFEIFGVKLDPEVMIVE